MKNSAFWGIVTFLVFGLPGVTALKSLGSYNLESSQGEVITTPDQGKTLKIVNSESRPQTLLLLTISNPPLQSAQWQVRGRVRYKGVAGDATFLRGNSFPAPSPHQVNGSPSKEILIGVNFSFPLMPVLGKN